MEEDIIMRSDQHGDLQQFSEAISERVEEARKAEIKKGYRPYATHSGMEVVWNPEVKSFVVFVQRVLFYETPEEANFDREFKKKSIAEANAEAQKAAQGAFNSTHTTTVTQGTPPTPPAEQQQEQQYAPKKDAQGRIEVGAAWKDKKVEGMLSVKRIGGGYFTVKEADLVLLNGELTYTNKESGVKTYWQQLNSTTIKHPIYRVFADGGN